MPDYSLEGPTWASHTVTWSFAQGGLLGMPDYFTNAIPSGPFQDLVRAAFARWAQVADLHFVESADARDVDIRLGQANIDGPGNVLAVTVPLADANSSFLSDLNIVFDQQELYSPGPTPTLSRGGAFFSVALHEIGHALGLAHYTDGPAILNPTISSAITDLQQSDIDGVQALYGATYTRYVYGTSAGEALYGVLGHSTVLAYDDIIFGGGGSDVVYGGAGNDWIWGSAGDSSTNYFYGGDGNDVLVSFDGNDVLYGGEGNDVIISGAGNDILYGDAGNDQLWGGAGSDLLYGGDGNDLLVGGLKGDPGYDTLYGGDGNDILIAGDGGSYLNGGDGNDQLWGGAGDDVLVGGPGADVLVGGGGNDTYESGGGAANFSHNVLILGTGRDTIMTAGEAFYGGGVYNDDIVWNFTVGQDVIILNTLDHFAVVTPGSDFHADPTANFEGTGLSGTMLWAGYDINRGHVLLLAGVSTTLAALSQGNSLIYG